MQVSTSISEYDLELVHSLQIHPRISWTRLARVLASDPVTVSRRWERLREAGAARVTAFTPVQGNRHCTAQVQLSCDLGQASAVALSLAEEPDVFTVQHSAGAYNVLIHMKAPNHAALSTFVMQRIGQISGVRSAITNVETQLYLDASTWELRALSAAQVRAIRTDATTPEQAGSISRTRSGDECIYHALVADGRISLSRLAEETGLSPSTARRRLHVLLASRRIVLRCDIARHLFGWGTAVNLHGTSATDPRPHVPELRRRVPELRLFAGIAAARNLNIFLWLRRLEDLADVETRLRECIPTLAVHERTVLLETVKQAGHILDELGRTVRIVPAAF